MRRVLPESQLLADHGTSHLPFLCISADDCEMEDAGRVLTFHCPYENILMEHCYKCFQPPDTEIIHCDGWTEQEIRDQCESAVPLPSPSPFVEEDN